MKKITTIVMAVFFAATMNAQQWDGPNNFTDAISRNGKVSIGTAYSKVTLNLGGDIRLVESGNTIGFGSKSVNVARAVEVPKFEIYHYENIDPLSPMGLYVHPGFHKVSGNVPNDKIALFISNSRKVGIGTNILDCPNCVDYRLFVKDGIKTEKVKVEIAASNGWADYVFKDDYKLMPLHDLDTFIKTNGHLPEVPTTEQAIANGIELKEMNILLLKKVEELTLYTLQQHKLLQEQSKRLQKLENMVNPTE